VQRIRELLAYGREFVQPRPYTLGDLAAAAGMSISGVRTAYGHHDVDQVAATTSAKPRDWRAPDPETAQRGAGMKGAACICLMSEVLGCVSF
jgi:hypothetical protein